MDISFCSREIDGFTENFIYTETQKDDGKINRGYISSSCKRVYSNHCGYILPMGSTKFRIMPESRFKSTFEENRGKYGFFGGLPQHDKFSFSDISRIFGNNIDYRICVAADEKVYCDIKFVRNNKLNQKSLFIGGLIDLSVLLKAIQIESGAFSFSEFSNFVKNSLGSNAPDIERAILDNEVEWHEYKPGFLNFFKTLNIKAPAQIPGNVLSRKNLCDNHLLSKKASPNCDAIPLENVDTAYSLLSKNFHLLAPIMLDELEANESKVPSEYRTTIDVLIRSLLLGTFLYDENSEQFFDALSSFKLSIGDNSQIVRMLKLNPCDSKEEIDEFHRFAIIDND